MIRWEKKRWGEGWDLSPPLPKEFTNTVDAMPLKKFTSKLLQFKIANTVKNLIIKMRENNILWN